MPVGISVHFETKALAKGLTRLEKKLVPKASAVAINRAGKSAMVASARHISKETTIKVSVVKVGMKFRKASAVIQRAFIVVRGKVFNIIRFKAKQTKTGVTAKAWGRKQFYPGAFIVKSNNQTGGWVAHRTGKTKRRSLFQVLTFQKKSRREQIDALHGPGILQEFGRKQTEAVIQKKVKEKYPLEFARDLNRRLGRL